ncbi:hypothetical protein CVT26_009217 [Gymnopilus dilepis]|uniref:Uncharacterized protein n=1 Tax=Gymnopilus dilepis TaxID=231916 RepID=A0A409WCA7_9AGAR|nr:hypothetical protein CVT26_009217 [Gymnopilus dilepis]
MVDSVVSQPKLTQYYYNTPYPPSAPLANYQVGYSAPTSGNYYYNTPYPPSGPPADEENYSPLSCTSYQCSADLNADVVNSSSTDKHWLYEAEVRRSGTGKEPSQRIRIAHPHARLLAHPYARLLVKQDGTKQRKIWSHRLEKLIFTPYELSTIGAPQRRISYIASLEAHVDRLHTQLEKLNIWPVSQEDLESLRGLNTKTAKSMVASLQYEASLSRMKLLELQRAASLDYLSPNNVWSELTCLLRMTVYKACF